jgi:Na+/melibiose symporter-like transporter
MLNSPPITYQNQSQVTLTKSKKNFSIVNVIVLFLVITFGIFAIVSIFAFEIIGSALGQNSSLSDMWYVFVPSFLAILSVILLKLGEKKIYLRYFLLLLWIIFSIFIFLNLFPLFFGISIL